VLHVHLCLECLLFHLWFFRLGHSLLPLTVWAHFIVSNLNFYNYCVFLSIRRAHAAFRHYCIADLFTIVLLKWGDMNKIWINIAKCMFKTVKDSSVFTKKNKAYHESHRHKVRLSLHKWAIVLKLLTFTIDWVQKLCTRRSTVYSVLWVRTSIRFASLETWCFLDVKLMPPLKG